MLAVRGWYHTSSKWNVSWRQTCYSHCKRGVKNILSALHKTGQEGVVRSWSLSQPNALLLSEHPAYGTNILSKQIKSIECSKHLRAVMISQNKHLPQAWYYRAVTLQWKAHTLDTLKLSEKYQHAVKWVHRHSSMICIINKTQKLTIHIPSQILNYSPAELELADTIASSIQ